MAGRGASLLTKKQRTRIDDAFADLPSDKRRRERQRIRDRVEAGLVDFRRLETYPDRQIELAVADRDPDALRRDLAAATLVVERARVLGGCDRDAVFETAQDVADAADADADLATLESIDLRPPEDVAAAAAAAAREEHGPGTWDRRAERLLRWAAVSSVPFFVVTAIHWGTALAPLDADGLLEVLWIFSFLFMNLFVVLCFAIKLAQIGKYDVVPWVHLCLTDPPRALRTAGDRLRSSGRSLRRVWRDL